MIFNDTSILIILALGQMCVILTKCIDLSVAANLALTGMVVAMINAAAPGVPVAALIAVAVAFGVIIGAFNGILVWKLDIPPIVVTLGTMTIYRGLIFVFSGGIWINAHEMSAAFTALPRASFLGLSVLSWTALAIIAASVVLIGRTPLGRRRQPARGGLHRHLRRLHPLHGLCHLRRPRRALRLPLGVARRRRLRRRRRRLRARRGRRLRHRRHLDHGRHRHRRRRRPRSAVPRRHQERAARRRHLWQLAISGAAIIVAVAFNARAERRKGRIILSSAEHAR